MKLLEFIQKYPAHTKRALCLLSIGFAACFSALVVMGFAVCHGKNVERNTNAALVAGDVLAIRKVQENGGEEVAVYRALIDARVSSCLSQRDAQSLAEILAAGGERFTALCDKLCEVVSENSCTAADLSTVIQEIAESGNSAALGVRYRKPSAEDASRGFALYDVKKLAEEFFGVRFVFQSAGNISYCGNLCGRFSENKGILTDFSAEWSVSADPHLSSEECILLAQNFAEQRVGIRSTMVVDTHVTDGVCWVNMTASSGSLKIGICTNTGRVCFYSTQDAA